MRLLALIGVLVASLTWSGPALGNDWFGYGDTIVLHRIEIEEDDPDKVARCDYLLRGDASRLWFGYVIEIPERFGDGTHEFRLVDGDMGLTFGADFDVTLTPELGSCEEQPAGASRFHNPGDEQGVVPAGTRYAIFTMRSTDTPGATFWIEIRAAGSIDPEP